MASINMFPSEVTPLVSSDRTTSHRQRELSCNNSHRNKVVFSLFLGVLFVGAFCGLYLLSIEGDTFKVVEKFDLVTRKEWGVDMNQTNQPPSKVPFLKVLFVQLEEIDGHNKKCNTILHNYSLDCNIKISLDLNNMKHRVSYGIEEIWYNFYVDGAGTIFEGRGYFLESVCEVDQTCDDILTLGFKGIQNSRTTSLAYKIKAFLDYGISKNLLNPCFKIKTKGPGESRKLVDIAFWIEKWNRKLRKAKDCSK